MDQDQAAAVLKADQLDQHIQLESYKGLIDCCMRSSL